jgi:hypothetical protein
MLFLHHVALLRGFGVSPVDSVVLGRDGQLFYSGDASLAARSRAAGSEAELAARAQGVIDGISRRAAYLKAKGIAYLVVIAPDKTSIYADKLPPQRIAQGRSVLDRVAAGLPAEVRPLFVDLRPALIAARAAGEVYYRTDSHWNPRGAAIAYDALVAALGVPPGGAPAFPVHGASRYGDRGGLAVMTGVPQDFAEPYFHSSRDIETMPGCELQVVRRDSIDRIGEARGTCPAAPLGRALVYRDSFFAPLMAPVAALFRESRLFWTNAWDVSLIDSFKPAVVIEQVVERDIANLAQSGFIPEVPR